MAATEDNGKKYGLFVPKKIAGAPKKALTLKKSNVFGDGSDDDDDLHVSKKPKISKSALQSKLKTQTQLEMEKALAEDPSVYEYDDVYDEMKEKKEKETAAGKNASKPSAPKYIGNLLKAAENRKKQDERRVERQVQKEREKEGEMYADKESFVTSSYRAKMEEMQKAEEEEKRREMLEDMMDVTKQNDMSGFYRHLLNQRTGEEEVPDNTKVKPLIKVEPPVEVKQEVKVKREPESLSFPPSHQRQDSDSSDEDTKPLDIKIKQETDTREKSKSKKSYRKRHSSSEPENETKKSKKNRSRSRSKSPVVKKEKSEDSKSHKKHKRSDKKDKKDKKKRSRSRSPKKEDQVENAMSDNEEESDNKTGKENMVSSKAVLSKRTAEQISEDKRRKRVEAFMKLYAKRHVGDKFEQARLRYLARREEMQIAIVQEG